MTSKRQGILPFSAMSKVLSIMLFSRLTPYVEKISIIIVEFAITGHVLMCYPFAMGMGGQTRNTAWWDTAAAVHIQNMLACIWEASGLIGGKPVALIESPRRYWVSNSNDAMTASFNIFYSSLQF